MSSCQRWAVSEKVVELDLLRRYELSELRLHCAVDRRRRLAFLQGGNRIYRRSTLRHHEVKMRTRCKSGRANQPNQFALFDGASFVDSGRNLR